MAGETGGQQGVTLRDYARVAWRRKWVVIGITVVLVGLALGYSSVKTPLYQATATLIYETPLDVSDPLSGSYVDSTQRQIELESVASVIASPDLIDSAREELSPADVDRGYSVAATPELTSGSSGGSTVLITAVSPAAETAARAANAYALAFTELRKRQSQEQVRQAEAVVQGQLDSFKSEESRQSAEYFTLLQRLQDLQILEATVTGNFRILVPATPPDEPFSPNPVRNGAMGLAAGLVLGIGLALLLEQFDTRVRTQEEAAAILRMPLIGAVLRLSTKEISRGPLKVLTETRTPAAEAIRKLRSNLEFADVDGDLRSLLITSALQHEGKSLTICGLALSLAAAGRRVVLVDGDLRRPQVHAYLGLPNGQGVSTVVTGKSSLKQTLCQRDVGPSLGEPLRTGGAADVARGEPLHVLTSGPPPPNPAELVASKSFAHVIDDLEKQYDLVIIDAPSVLAVGDAAAIARSVDGLLLLVDLARAKRPLLEETAHQIDQMPCRKLGLVVVANGASRRYADHYVYHADGEAPFSAAGNGDGRRATVRLSQPTGADRSPFDALETDDGAADREDVRDQ